MSFLAAEEDRDLYYYVKDALKFPFHGKLQLPDGAVADCKVRGLSSQSAVPGRRANFWFDVWVQDTKGEGHVIYVPPGLLRSVCGTILFRCVLSFLPRQEFRSSEKPQNLKTACIVLQKRSRFLSKV